MSRVFPPDSRAIAAKLMLAVVLLVGFAVAVIWYYATPAYSRVGFTPVQPINFSHELHVGKVGLDCTFCHSSVTDSAVASIPTTLVCWNCHGQEKGAIRWDSGQLAPLREARQSGLASPWVRVHKLPDYAFFNHAVHVQRGVSCVSCHGRVDQMDVVRHEQPLSMAWCLDCHRHPEPALRPRDQVTNLSWEAARDPQLRGRTQQEFAAFIRDHTDISPPLNCSGCHR